MIVTQAVLDALRVTFDASFKEAYSQAPVFFDKLATQVASAGSKNVYGWMAHQTKFREWIGPRQAQALAEHKFEVANRKFELTLEVDRVAIEDDTLQVYSSMLVPELGMAAAKFPDQLLKTILQSNPTGFDGKALFATDHPVYDAGGSTYSNLYASGKALTADNFNTVWSDMSAFKGEDGEPLGLIPDLLIVPPQLRRVATEIVGATGVVKIVQNVAATENVASAAIDNVMQGWCDVLVIPELANQATQWYVACTKRPIKPFVYQVRSPLETVMRTNPDDPKVFDQDQFTYGCRMRAEMAPTLPFLIARAQS